ncbi:MAG TPA: gamma-glutamyltransferase family protein [Polyangiaceae bacterium]|nr:gamma-glutamyltransferase family protein [Polyangiaceae bacterium]HPB94745.1 gamma-glutamyltransferase family protein [Polyangiaceae bacterium]HQM07965.1 gamma-glutamyltransferase family protein [Polyangiaceae bacterium]
MATSQPLAAQAGLRMLASGGNAVDAAIAAAAALTIVEPVSCGLGGDAFAMVWDGHRLHGLNASGTAPASWSLTYFTRRYGSVFPQRGADTVTIPGAVAGWAALHNRFGRLSLSDCLEPAIELACQGFGVTPIVQTKWAAQVDALQSQPGFASTFMPHGRAPFVGERFVLAQAAQTLRRIGQSAGRDAYEGQTAEKIVGFLREHGGRMTLADLREFQPIWVEPISREYHGFALHELPPNGQGIAALITLGLLDHFDFPSLAPDTVTFFHLPIEAMKAAFSQVYRHVTDDRHMIIEPVALLDDARLAQLASRIRLDAATDFDQGLPPAGDTVYLATADASGMMVSFIQSNYMGFGSGLVVPDIGVSLQNRGCGFCLEPNHPNVVAPRKRPFHTIIPAFLTRNGAPQMCFGVMGGNMQPQGHVQTLLRMIDHHQNPQTACDAPRWKVQRGLQISLEPSIPMPVRQGLADLGHQIVHETDSYMDFGSGQFIWRLSDDLADGYMAASDHRRDGCAVGF